MTATGALPGTVDWSGEHPLISLKETPDGDFVTLASFFRVVLSPHGRGHALVLLQSPSDAHPPPESANFCFTDNPPLARYLINGYLAHFGAYKGLAGLVNLAFRPIDRVTTSGDAAATYRETVEAGELTIQLTWSKLGQPFAVMLPPDQSATGCHHMPSVIVGASEARVTINERRLPGYPVPRTFAGHAITSAMLAFSETWVLA